MKVFVTGATGVIGRRAIPLLVAAGHQVTAISRSAVNRALLEQMGAMPVQVELFAAEALRRAVMGQAVVINLATHLPLGGRMFLPGAWRTNDRIRRDASAILVEAALAGGVERFIQESFAPVYPDCGDAWIDETMAIRPARYNRTVADAEQSAARFTQSGRTGIVLRFSNFYGPDARQTRDLITVVRKGWAPIPGSADSYFSSVSHDDAATAVVAALGIPAGAYNVTDDEPLQRREFFDTLARALGVPPPKIPPAWVGMFLGSLGETLTRSLRISNRKLRETSGWAPRYPSVREGWPAVVAALAGAR